MTEKGSVSFTLHRVLTPDEEVVVERGGDSVVPINAQRIINMAVRSVLETSLRQIGACDDVDSCMKAEEGIRLLYESCRVQLNAMFFLAKGEAMRIFSPAMCELETKMPCVEEGRVGDDGLYKVFFSESSNDAVDVACNFLAETIRNSVLRAVGWRGLPKRFKADDLEGRAGSFDENLAVFRNSIGLCLSEFSRDVGRLLVEVPEGLTERLDEMIRVTFAGGCDDFNKFKKYLVGVLKSEEVLSAKIQLEFCGTLGVAATEVIELLFDLYFSDEEIDDCDRLYFLRVFIGDLVWLGKIYENGFSGGEAEVAEHGVKNIGGCAVHDFAGVFEQGETASVVELFPDADKKSRA